jgi:hypothetical protein
MLCTDKKLEIDRRSYELRQDIFDNRHLFWGDRRPRGLEVAEPQFAAQLLGFDLQYHDSLDLMLPGMRKNTAGVFCRKQGFIVVARRFGDLVTRFTAAHEVGHALYHEHDISPLMHRDLPIGGLEHAAENDIEREANHFAACFLMPRKYVADQFKIRFPSDGPLTVDDAAVHHLRVYARDSLLYPTPGSLDRERIFARARSWNGHPFPPLAELFKVSVETMAIRIRELGLLR